MRAPPVERTRTVASENKMNLRKPATPAEPLVFGVIDVDDISASPLNHREIFRGIEDLGKDIMANGLRVPIKVRPWPGGATPYQLVYGERRWRAAKHAKVERLPALIRELNDTEVIEEQLVENVGREDVHPMEEAEGYDALLKGHNYDVDMIAKKVGKSRTAVYNRLKLLKLCPRARKAFLEDKINASIADLIARIPTLELQESAIEEIVRGRRVPAWQLVELDEELPESDSPDAGLRATSDEVLPLSFREAQLLIQRRYMLRLELAPFDKADASLHPEAGACTNCLHRTGNQPDLFSDVPSTDVCTNPPCFAKKKDADWARKSAAAKKDGKQVLANEEAQKVFQGDRLGYNAPYYDLKAEADWQLQPKTGDKRKTWGEVLGKNAPADIVLARDDGGAAHELVPKKAAEAALKAAGKWPTQTRGYGGEVDKKAQAAVREKQRVRDKTAALAIAELVAAQASSLKEAAWLAECVIRQASMEAHQGTCDRRGIETSEKGYGREPREKALLKYAAGLKDEAELFGLMRELHAWESATSNYQSDWGRNLKSAAAVFKLDLGKLQAKVAADSKAAKAQKGAKGKKGGRAK